METGDCQLFLCLKDINLINAGCQAHTHTHAHPGRTGCITRASVDTGGGGGKPSRVKLSQGIDCPASYCLMFGP